MYNLTEREEKEYLHFVYGKLTAALNQISDTIQNHYKRIIETKKYMWENSSQLDTAERAANRIAAYDETSLGESALKKRDDIKKMMLSPYFGRIDFLPSDECEEESLYIGIHSFMDRENGRSLVYDWRAPISGMFYDFEIGNAYYQAPSGVISGTVMRKRQYKVKNDELEYMIESGLNIDDDILQQELSRNSDEKMKNIISTIQREQNKIIRDETTNVLIIQGAAGSGKTSIALHRVAFLLYRFRKTLRSDNIMILSPNKVFASYISNVLPELGEENIPEIGFEELARRIIGAKLKFQTFSEQVEELLAADDKLLEEQIEYKSANTFVDSLDEYLLYAETNYFTPKDLDIDSFHMDKESIQQKFNTLKGMPIKKRLNKVASDIIGRDKNHTERLLNANSARLVKNELFSMFLFADSLSLYENYYVFIGHKEYFSMKGKNHLDYSDVFPFIYVKMFFEEIPEDYKNVKHLLIDEMQDYTPIQYAVLSKLFSCQMTILGDLNQSVNPYSSSAADKITPYFKGYSCVELQKSYRSTYEIMELAQSIKKNNSLIPMERHGQKPTFISCRSFQDEVEEIYDLILEFEASNYNSLGILCKTQKQAGHLFQALSLKTGKISFIDFGCTEYKEGIVITTVHMAKGLEFDWTIVPDASQENYASEMDRGLLYIASTRAMHRLDLTYVKNISAFFTEIN